MLTRNNNLKIWCDYCKLKWGQEKDKVTQQMVWHLKAQTPAVWTITSSNPRFSHITRHYCNPCSLEVTHWACNCSDTYFCKNRWNLHEQTTDVVQLRMEIGNEL